MQPDLPEQAPPAPAQPMQTTQPMQPVQAQPAPQMSPYMNAGYAPGGGGFSFNRFFIIGLSLAMVSVLLLSIPDMFGGAPQEADYKPEDADDLADDEASYKSLVSYMEGWGGLLMGASVLCITMALIKEGFDSDVTHVALRCVLVASGAWLLSSYIPIILGAIVT